MRKIAAMLRKIFLFCQQCLQLTGHTGRINGFHAGVGMEAAVRFAAGGAVVRAQDEAVRPVQGAVDLWMGRSPEGERRGAKRRGDVQRAGIAGQQQGGNPNDNVTDVDYEEVK